MARAWQLLVQARGDSSGGQRAMRDLQRAGRRLSSAIGIDFKRIAKMGALAMGAGLAATVRVGVQELMEAQKITAQTNAVIKSTGGAARVSAKGVAELAESISLKTGVDDEQIQSGQNMLLTFTNVQNRVGKGNDVFNQATRIMTDMSVALGKDAPQAAVGLGKALNDPVKGVTALQKIGVTFTEGQKKSIASLMKHGKTAAAQKVILKELNKEFGGSAKAFGKSGPGAIARAKNAFSELAADLVTAVGPSIASVGDKALKLVKDIKAWTQTKAGKDALDEARSALQLLGSVIKVTVKSAIEIAKKLYEWREVLIPIGAGILAIVTALKIWRIATAAAAVAQAALNVVLSANPIGLIVLAIAGLVAGLVVAYRRSETFRNIVDKVWGVLKKVWGILMDNKQAFLALLGPVGLTAAALITAYQKSETFRAVVHKVWDVLKNLWSILMDNKQLLLALLGPIGLTAAALITAWRRSENFRKVLKAIADTITKNVKSALTWIRNNAASAWTQVTSAAKTLKTWIGNVASTITGAFATAIGWVRKNAASAWSGVKSAVGTVKDAVTTIASSLTGGIQSGLKWIRDNAEGAWSGFKSAAKTVKELVVAIRDALSSAWSTLNKIAKKAPSIPNIDVPGFARGGIVRGPMLATVGERGPEAIVPLGSGALATRDRNRVMGQAGLGGAGSVVIQVNASGSVLNDPHALAARLAWVMRTRGLAGRMA